ncbi:hypothetical protein BC833DRAFT_662157 [Globomyces pollinis-pini]|nr:hypothetical protein BC833DRAFT_662157 [Globomyces pollinis-pini]
MNTIQKILIILLTTYQVVTAYQVALSHWLQSYRCDGPPTVVYYFENTDIESYDNGNDTVPNTYYYSKTGGYCGNYMELTFSQCCLSTLDLTLSNGYQSLLPALVDDFDGDVLATLTANSNGGKYCYIQPTTTELTPTLFNQMLFLADNSCIDGAYRCSKNGTFQTFADTECLKPIESFPLSIQESDHESNSIGHFIGQMKIIEKAENTIIWTTYLPNTAAVPNTSSTADILTHVCQVIYLGAVLLLTFRSIIRYRKGKQTIWFFYILLNIFRLVLRITHVVYWYTPITDWNQSFLFGWVYYCFVGIEYLWTVLITAFQIFQLEMFKKFKWLRNLGLIIIIIVHLVFYGSNYFFICAISYVKGLGFCISDSFRYSWMSISPYWMIFMVVCNILPAILIPLGFHMQSNNEVNILKSIKEIVKLDGKFNFTIMIQLIIIIIYFVIASLQRTAIFGDDRVAFLFIHVSKTLIGIHEILLSFTLDRLRAILPLLANKQISHHVKSKLETTTKNTQHVQSALVKSD